MQFKHGHTLVGVGEVARVLRYTEEAVRDRCGATGVQIRTGGLVTLKDVGRVFGTSVSYLSVLLDGADRLLTHKEAAHHLGLTVFRLYQNPIGRMIDQPQVPKRYSTQMIEGISSAREAA